MENNSFSEEVIEENVGKTAQPRQLVVRESDVVIGDPLPPAKESKEDLINDDVQEAPPNQMSAEVIE